MSRCSVRIILLAVAPLLLVTSAVGQREKSALMPSDVARYMHPPNPDLPKAPTWEPTKEDIRQMESSFDKLAVLKPDRECCRHRSNFIFKPEEYYMQYAAVFLDGHAYIYINAFRELPKTWEAGWRLALRMAKGGGTDFWQVLYDPETKTFSRLTFNADE